MKPAHRKEMAIRAVHERQISIHLACEMFGIREGFYGYCPKHTEVNAEIADWLIRLSTNSATGALAGTTNGSTGFTGS